MPLYRPVVNDVIEVKVGCYGFTQAGINVRHYLVYAVTGVGANLLDMAIQIDTDVDSLYKAAIGNDVSYYGVSCNKIWPLPAATYEETHAHAGVGGTAGPALPTQMSGIVTFYTDRGGQRYRGRIYLPFPSTAQMAVTNVPDSAYVTAAQAIGTYFATGLTVPGGTGNTTQMVPIIFHRDDHSSDEIISAEAQPKYAAQHRRGNYGRPNSYPPF